MDNPIIIACLVAVFSWWFFTGAILLAVRLCDRNSVGFRVKIGNSFLAEFDKYNNLVFSVDIQRLLVPTPAFYVLEGTQGVPDDNDGISNEYVLLSGRSNDVGVIAGMIQSFYDAPGVLATDEAGNYIQNADGTYEVVSGSRLKEELSEINVALGLEYWYNNLFAHFPSHQSAFDFYRSKRAFSGIADKELMDYVRAAHSPSDNGVDLRYSGAWEALAV